MNNPSRIAAPRPFTAPTSAPRLARALACAAAVALAPHAALACSGRLHVEIADSGVYALDYAAVVAAQPGLGDCPSEELTLLERGKEVPIRIVGASAGKFGAGARIEWVGQRLHGPQSWYDAYSNVNVYQLAARPGTHARMREIDAGKATPPVPLLRSAHFEQENLMLRLSDREMKPGDEPDVWQWAKLTPIDTQPFTWDFDLPDLAPARGNATAQLTVSLRGVSDVPPPKQGAKPIDHLVEISINGKALARQSWDGRDEVRRNLSVPLGLLKAKGNTIAVRVPERDGPNGDFIVDVVMFNWFEVGYPARGQVGAGPTAFSALADGTAEITHAGAAAPVLYDAAGGYRPSVAVGGGRFRARIAAHVDTFAVAGGELRAPTRVRAVAAADLRAATPGYDYLIVAHPRLIDAIRPLAEFHRQHGLHVAVADVDGVYDDFNGGITHPVAIRRFVEWGREHWRIKPRYLLLVGDASVDIHHDVRVERLSAGAAAMRPHPPREEIMLPGVLSNMPTTSYTKWDPDLPNRDLIPTWQFPSPEGQAASDNGFAALEPGDFHPTIAVGRLPVIEPAEVSAIVNKTIAYMTRPAPGDWRRELTFVSTDEVAAFKSQSERIAADLGAEGYSIKSLYTKQDATEAAYAHAELTRYLDGGNLLVHFLGHGGAFIWRVGPPADLFTLDDVSKLTNADRYPMVLAMTCFSAPFDNPTEDSIGERFLREANRGAVAVFAASWTNTPNPQHSKLLIDALLEPGERIGDAIVAAKAQVDDPTFVQMYNLLGDPAVILARPRGELQLARGADRWADRVLVRVPESGFGGEVDVDWVDLEGNTFASHRYEVRDSQFALPVPSARAAEVRIHAANLRTGFGAIGALRLAAAPAAPPEAPRVRQGLKVIEGSRKPASTRAPAPVAPAAARHAAGKIDRIVNRGFETIAKDAPAAAPTRAGAVRTKAPAGKGAAGGRP